MNIYSYLKYGISSDIAQYLYDLGISISDIKNNSKKDLLNKYKIGDDIISFIKDCTGRKPIDEKTILKLLEKNNYMCCACKGLKSDAYIIHHIIEYSKSEDNTYSNLALLCPNDHDIADLCNQMFIDMRQFVFQKSSQT